MGLFSKSSIKYIISLVLSILSCFYISANVLDISSCLSAIKVISGLFLAIEVANVLIGGNRDSQLLREKNNWKVRGVIVSICQVVGCLLALHGVIVLFGAPLFSQVSETFHLSLLVTCLTCVRPFLTLGSHALHSLLTYKRITGVSESEVRAVLVLCGAWLGALPIPLDWDRPWQTWPLTCTFGALLGEAAASVYLLSHARQLKPLHSTR
uniref:Phosphatidylinositol-glycan biosynthesis class F protein-like n=2 Tax=Hirondellea gigas TaxID=1518452 RepID=A0A2P2I522_9CRUS